MNATVLDPPPCPTCDGTGGVLAHRSSPEYAEDCRACGGDGIRRCASCPTEHAVVVIYGEGACLVCADGLLSTVGRSGGCETTWAEALDMDAEHAAIRAKLEAVP